MPAYPLRSFHPWRPTLSTAMSRYLTSRLCMTHSSDADHQVFERSATCSKSEHDPCGHGLKQAHSKHIKDDSDYWRAFSQPTGSAFTFSVESKGGKLLQGRDVSISSPNSHICIYLAGKNAQSESAVSEVTRKVRLLQAEGITPSHATLLLQRRPFKLSSFEHLSAVVKLLKEYFASNEVAFQVLVTSPGVLLHPIKNIHDKFKVLNDFHISLETAIKLCGSGVRLLSYCITSAREKFEFLKEIGFTVEATNKLLHKNPALFRYIRRQNWEVTVEFLRSIGFSDEKIYMIFHLQPGMISLSADNSLAKKYTFLQQFGYTLDNFTRALKQGVPKYSLEALEEKVKFFYDNGFSQEEVTELIKRQPRIFLYTTTVLKSKLDFLIDEHNRSKSEIVKCPQSLQFSLKGRLVPRFKILEELGVLKRANFNSFLLLTNSEFAERFQHCKNGEQK